MEFSALPLFDHRIIRPKLLVLAALAFFAFAGTIEAQSDACDALEVRLTSLMNNVSKEDGRWVKKTLMPSLCAAPAGAAWIETVEEVVTALEDARASGSKDIRNYLRTVLALSAQDKQGLWDDWHSFSRRMWSNKKHRKTGFEFLAISPELITNNILYSTNKHWWEVDSMRWKVEWRQNVPMLIFENAQLTARNEMDHFTILNTSGEWDLRDEELSIASSTVHWEGTTFNPNMYYAELPASTIDLKSDRFQVPSCIMHAELAGKPLKGTFVVKLESAKSPVERSYPRFRCEEEQIELKEVFPQTNYTGGVQFKGSQILGIRNETQRARIDIMQADTTFMEFHGSQFLFSSSGWSCSNAEFIMHFGGDTLSHPDVQSRYNNDRRQVAAYRQEQGLGQQHFLDKHHDLEWDVSGILWEINQPTVLVGSALDAGQSIAQFSSTNYFEQSSFDAIQGIDPVNPVIEVYRFTRDSGRSGFMTEDFARYIRMGEVQARVMLMQLANLGYVKINPETLWVQTTPKLKDHIYCKTGRKDYDVIRFNSSPVNGVNAEWSLLNGHFQINGIDKIRLSTAKDVALYPANGEIVVKRDRDFLFDGRIQAGNIQMAGDAFAFDYSDFTIDFDAIETVQLSVYNEDELNNRGIPRKRRLNSQIEGVSGTLSIDYPTNRSGRRSDLHPDYPVFESTVTSFVYYDRFDLFEGAYARDDFYFAVKPFQLKKLDNLTKSGFTLDGTLVSAGILRDLPLPLKVMDDYYLGLETTSAPEGIDVYSDAATFTKDIKLDGKGLQGQGSIDFITAHIESSSMTMLPDSIVGQAELLINEADEERNTAAMQGVNGTFSFHPTLKQLDMSSGGSPFEFYQEEARLTGLAKVTPRAFTGRGLIELKDASLSSDEFDFLKSNLKSPSATFSLNGSRSQITAFRTDDVACDLDFQERLGVFSPNSGETRIELPIQQYICFMDRFRWYMDEAEIDLLTNRGQEGLPLDFNDDRTSSNFISAHPDQDSLHFLSSSATYRIGEDMLTCNGVESLAIADSRIIPDSGRLIIRAKAKMDELRFAQIVANVTTRYHFIDSAFLNVSGKYSFEGAGLYNYKSVDGKVNRILFDDIQVDDSLRTIGGGSIMARNGFLLGPAFAFAGDIKMVSSQPHLYFKGGAKMTKECKRMQRSWIAFQGYINPEAIAIPVSNPPQDTEGDLLAYGIMASLRPPFTLYGAFLDPQGDESDLNILSTEGELRYQDKRYIFSSKEKFENPTSSEAYVDIRPSTCDLRGAGLMTLPLDFGLVNQSFVGSFEINSRGEYVFQGSMRLDIDLDQDLYDRMALQIPSWEPAEPVNIVETNYEQALQAWLGAKESAKLVNDLAMTGKLKNTPKSMRSQVVLTGLEMTWDPRLEAFVSSSEFAIASLGSAPVFQAIPGKLVLRRSRSNDSFTLYLHGDEENWYHFEYRKTTLNCSTPDRAGFLSAIAEISDKKRTKKDGDGRIYSYKAITNHYRRNDFVDEYREFQ
ncbi:hypothetical protein OAF30_01020 [Flavobacteriales bacterium]|nr:hypothetical protein [Flavobacteriales bacterium]